MSNPSTVGKRVQRLRLAAGLSQADFAKRTVIPTGVVSMIENGRQAADADTLEAIASNLNVTATYLIKPPREVLSTRPWLRAYADASKRAVDRYVADTLIAVETIEAIGLKTLPEMIPTFDGDPNDDEAIEELAAAVRHAAKFDDGDVVGNCMRAAERLGCVLLPMEGELGRHMGMSMRVNGTPVIRISRPHINDEGHKTPSGDRQRFTVAHELGHLAMHSTCPPPATADEASRIEKQAHRFAGAFLTPAEPLLDDLQSLGGRVTLSTLLQLKDRWGVAVKMLVLRMQQLERVDAAHARSLYKQISARKWNKVEPGPVGHEDAIWLQRSLAKAYTRNSTQRMDPIELAASHAGLDRKYFDCWIDWSTRESEPGAEIVDLVPRVSAPATESGKDAVVTRLHR